MELLVDTPMLLKEGHIVHFGEGWRNEKERKFFKVLVTQQLTYDVIRIVAPGNANIQDVSFMAPNQGGVSNDYISLLPVNTKTLYEILVGFKGIPMVYPRYANRYQLQLEESQVLPTPSDTTYLAWMGYFDAEGSPYYAPKVRVYTVKDQEPPHWYLFNPYQDDEKIVIRNVVNKCQLEKLENPTEQQVRVAREVTYYTKFIW
jgi:hypothetical protein